MRPIAKILTVVLLGLIISACAKPFYRQTPEGQAVKQTMDAFWLALRTGDQAALDNQLTSDAAFIRVEGRDPAVEVPLTIALKRPEDRVLLSAAERQPLVNFEQPTPQSASLNTHLEITGRDDIQRVRMRWHLERNGDAWRLRRVNTTIWIFPRPPRGSGP